MKFITKSFDLRKGYFKVELDRPCRCYVGLVEWHMPSFDSKHYTDNIVDITCEQIDSSFDNPKRLLKRVVSSNVKWQHMTHYKPNFIDYKLIDSQDRFLKFFVVPLCCRLCVVICREFQELKSFCVWILCWNGLRL